MPAIRKVFNNRFEINEAERLEIQLGHRLLAAK
jgi:hypothetical protein